MQTMTANELADATKQYGMTPDEIYGDLAFELAIRNGKLSEDSNGRRYAGNYMFMGADWRWLQDVMQDDVFAGDWHIVLCFKDSFTREAYHVSI